MNVGLFRGTEAMAASQRRLESITANLANAGVTAFKRIGNAHHGVEVAGKTDPVQITTEQVVDWSQGALERTGMPTDLALMGEGFFAVEGSEGEVYTRDGHFAVDESGQLVTQEGYPIAWDGSRGVLDPIGKAVSVDGSGAVWQGENQAGRLKLVDFPARDLLRQDRNGYFVADPALERVPATAEVHQGALERSNVSTVDELVSMIQTQRAFQAGAKVVQLISQSYERLLRGR